VPQPEPEFIEDITNFVLESDQIVLPLKSVNADITIRESIALIKIK